MASIRARFLHCEANICLAVFNEGSPKSSGEYCIMQASPAETDRLEPFLAPVDRVDCHVLPNRRTAILPAYHHVILEFSTRRALHLTAPRFTQPSKISTSAVATTHPMLPIVLIVTALVAGGVLPAAGGSTSITIPHDRTFEARSPAISLGVSLAATSSSASGDDLRGIWAEYETTNCSDAPVMVIASSICTFQSSIEGCSDLRGSDSSSQASESTVVGATGQCTTNLSATLDDLFGDQAYIAIDYYTDSSCSDFSTTNIVAADGVCHPVELYDSDTGEHEILSRIAKIWDNGTASVTWYNASDCVGATASTVAYSDEQQSSSECRAGTDGTSTIGYSSGVVKENDGGLSTGAIVGIVVACVAFLALVAGLVLWRRQRSRRSGGVDGVDGTALQAPDTPVKDPTPYQSAA